MRADWLRPEWRADGVGAVMTTRLGGVSAAPFDTMNLHGGIGDDASAIARNRALLAQTMGAAAVFLKQVHGATVVQLSLPDAAPDAAVHVADASITTELGLACTVLVADCLPVLFAAPRGRGVAAAHAGWRGLSLGVLEATVLRLCEAAACEPAELRAWLGACIGPRRFEVGPDVLNAFGVKPEAATPDRFKPHAPGKWMANLPLLASDRLRAIGVDAISGGSWCTVEDRARFFSFRRDGLTGRMAASVWIGV